MSLTERLISRAGQGKTSRSTSYSWFRNCGCGSWSRWPPKSNGLVLGPRPTPPKNWPKTVHNLLKYTTKCQCKPYLLIVKNLENDPWSTTETRSPPKSKPMVLGPQPVVARFVIFFNGCLGQATVSLYLYVLSD